MTSNSRFEKIKKTTSTMSIVLIALSCYGYNYNVYCFDCSELL